MSKDRSFISSHWIEGLIGSKLLVGVVVIFLFVNPHGNENQPHSQWVFFKRGVGVAFNGATRTPSWVLEQLEPNLSDFSAVNVLEKEIPYFLRPKASDYSGSNYSMASLFFSEEFQGNHVSFATCPMHTLLNQGFWDRLRKYVKEKQSQVKSLEVISGPLYTSSQNILSLSLLGETKIAVSSHFFCLIRYPDEDGREWISECYKIPNQNINAEEVLKNFEVAPTRIQIEAGILFPTRFDS